MAFEALAKHLGKQPQDLDKDISVLGYSMGAGAGLEFAVRHPVRRVILLAPFTSIVDMARLVAGWPICYIAPDHYNNRARIHDLLARKNPPSIDVFHGPNDEVIPYRMGEELAIRHPGKVVLHTVSDAHHGDLPTVAEKEILDLLVK